MENITEKERQIILARLESVSSGLSFSSGSNTKTYTRDEMIKLIQRGDRVGDEFVKVEFEFLRAFKDGTLMRQLSSAA
jgi:hypothetical protein